MTSRRRLGRRQVLRGLGAAVALPALESLQPSGAVAATATPRIIFCYVPNGKNVFAWRPSGRGRDYELSPTLRGLMQHKRRMTVLSGLGHPHAKGGHAGADTWLTGADLQATPGQEYTNSVSIDQVIAQHHAAATRFPSLQLSDRSGTGIPGHTATLSFDRAGTPLPAEDSPRRLFDRMFVAEDVADRAAALRHSAEQRSILDSVAAEAANLRKRLGQRDRHLLDEYLGSVRATETQVQRREAWLNVPKKSVDGRKLELAMSSGNAHDRPMWIDVMLDISKLAFLTDSTRVITFEWSIEASGFGGSGENHHELSHHGGDEGTLRKLAEVDRFHVARLARFLDALAATPDAGGTLLDRTVVVYGSGMNSGTNGEHSPKDLPLLVAGGEGLGLRHGSHLAFDAKTAPPLSNLLLTLARAMGTGLTKFQDSSGPLRGMT